MLRRAFRLPYLPIWLLPLLLLSPVMLAGKALFWGTPALQFLPWRVWAWRALLSGHLPLWNPLVGMGAPLIANYQSGLFYPPNWIYFLLGAIGGISAMAWGQSLLVVLHLILAGTGMVALMKRLNFGVLAQTVSGLAFSLSGYLVARSGFLSINAAAAWVPWVILGTTSLVQENFMQLPPTRKRRSRASRRLRLWARRKFSPELLGLSAALGMQLLAGHAQTAWYTILLASAWGSYLALNGKQTLHYDFVRTVINAERRFTEIPVHRRAQPLTGLGIASPGGQQRAEREISASVPGFTGKPIRAEGNGWHGKLTYNQVKEKSNGHNLGTRSASWWKRLQRIGVSRAEHAIRRLLVRDWKEARHRLTGAWVVLGLSFAFAAALAAIQLLPTAEYLSLSQRASAYVYERAMTYSFWPWRFLTLIAPGLFGSPVTGDYWGYGFYWEDAVYIGLLPFLLAIGVLVSRRKGKQLKRLSIFLAAIIVISFLLALGKNTPVFPWLYRNIPTFNMFQAPSRFTLWAVFALAVLAGVGAEMWRRPEGRSLYWTRLGVMAAVAVALGAVAAWLLVKDIRPSFVRSTAVVSIFGIGSGVLALLAPRQGTPIEGKRQQIWAYAVVLLVSLDLILAGWGLNPGVGTEFYTREPPGVQDVQAMAEGGRIYLFSDDEYQLKFNRFLLAERFQTDSSDASWESFRESLLPDINLLYGIASANNFDPLVPGRYENWIEALQTADPGLKESLLNLMGVKVVETVGTSTANGMEPDQTAGTERASSEPVTFNFEARTKAEAAVRAHWFSCWRVAKNAEDSLAQVMSGKMNLQSEVVVEENGSPIGQRCLASSNPKLEVSSDNPNQIDVDLRAETDGFLVLSDVWYPGWRAWVDGRPTDVLKADYLFRAVPASKGEHRITLIYQPQSFYLGTGISLISCFGLLIYLTRSRKLW